MKCIYCLSEAGDTRDHVPPKCLIRRPYPPNLFTVPSCFTCNTNASPDEEYFRLVVVGLLCHTTEADELFDNPISRSMDRNARLEDLMVELVRPFENSGLLDVDEARIHRVAAKVTRGLEFISTGKIYSENQKFESEFFEVSNDNTESRFGPDFTYQRSSTHSFAWELTFFSSTRFIVRPT